MIDDCKSAKYSLQNFNQNKHLSQKASLKSSQKLIDKMI